MEILWLGHSCFRLRADDIVVVTDPFPRSLGLRPDPRPATVVTVSNSHPNHCNWEEVNGEPRVFKSPGEYEYRSISVRGVMTTLPGEVDRERRNVAYTVELDGVSICHLGDIAVPPTPAQIDDLSPVDVLLAPTGGGCTMDVDQVFQTMQDIAPKIVVPMHHSIPGVNIELQELDAFLRRMGVSEVQPQRALSVTTSNLPTDMRVVALAPQARAV